MTISNSFHRNISSELKVLTVKCDYSNDFSRKTLFMFYDVFLKACSVKLYPTQVLLVFFFFMCSGDQCSHGSIFTPGRYQFYL